MKNLLFFLVLLPSVLYAQNFENIWSGFFAYNNIVDTVEGNDQLFVASENTIFTYDFTTREIQTITTINGLTGDLISKIHYSELYDLIVVGYASGLIEIIMEDGKVLKIVDILNKPTIPPNLKEINNFNEFGENLYIATKYGISVFNLALLEFGDSYYIGENGQYTNINATVVFNNFIYASLDNEMKRAPVDSPNLIDPSIWQTNYIFGTTDLKVFRGNLYALDNAGSLLVLQGGNFDIINSYPESNVRLYANTDYLNVTTNSNAYVYDRELNEIASVTSVPNYSFYTLSASVTYKGNLYLATNRHGILELLIGTSQVTEIRPDGPLLNMPFGLDTTSGVLWVVFGEVNQNFNPFPLNQRGISKLQNNEWLNIPYEDVLGARSIVNIKINPSDPTEVFASSMHDGLLLIKDNIPVTIYDETNSSLEVAGLSENDASIRLYGADYDRQGDLWFVQAGAIDALKKYNGGSIQGFDITSVVEEPNLELGLNKLVVSEQGNVFFGSQRSGLIGYNPSTDTFGRINEGVGNGNLPDRSVRAVAIDKNNQIWVGTRRGLRVHYNPSSFFTAEGPTDAQSIIILDGDIGQELLFNQSITDIEVDGSNNKWVATSSSGAFYFSSNGQETLLRFNKENSPLPSNDVRDIAIDPSSGVVYFATANGLVSYNGSATAPNDNLKDLRAYPNPVRPGFAGFVTIAGLTEGANVKVTDVNGSLVFEETSQGGSVIWDTTAFGKYKVASGVYFIMATTEDASETNIAKIMVVR